MPQGNVGLAFLLTTLAGLSTAIGSALAMFTRRANKTFLSAALGFSAGVMIFVSFVELYPMAREAISKAHGPGLAGWYTAFAFFGGVALIMLIDYLVPEAENPHEAPHRDCFEGGEEPGSRPPASSEQRLMRVGVLSALVIGIHNFPEGMATFISALTDPRIAVSITVAIALHNIPEGIAVAAPIYFATGNRKRAFWLSASSGLAEPVGALVAYLVLRPFLSDGLLGIIFAGVAGIMVFISLDELIPTAREYGKGHASVYGLVGGMMVMAASLLIGH
ncbi:MAG: zinc transporter ZupT [Polyangia bacterium]|jgi:ZIP family zinc transporter|nr:zinc transporter ZupT [Polyangia bacterium]